MELHIIIFFPDTERKKYIGALGIYCTNNSKGCAWNGQLRNLQYHIRENSRHGECQFEVVRCRYLTCSVKLTRNALEYHEDKCHLRACQCNYCGFEETYRTWVLQKYELDHYKYCPGYPVPCPKKCDAAMRIPRRQIEGHLKYYCPLQVIECKLRWTGCTETHLRKDTEKHFANNIAIHFTLLARVCQELKTENAELKKQNLELKGSVRELKGKIRRSELQ